MNDLDRIRDHAEALAGEVCDRYCIHSLAIDQSRGPHRKAVEYMTSECDRCPIDKLMKLIYPEEE